MFNQKQSSCLKRKKRKCCIKKGLCSYAEMIYVPIWQEEVEKRAWQKIAGNFKRQSAKKPDNGQITMRDMQTRIAFVLFSLFAVC